VAMKPNGEFKFSLTEKRDRNGDMYLFGGIHFINGVLFVRPTGESGPDGPKWEAVVRPYTGQQHQSTPDEDVWADGPPRQQTTRRQR